MTKFVKGMTRNSLAGRKAGIPNKTTGEMKSLITDLVSNNMSTAQEWIDRVAEKDPAKALDILIKMSDFVLPRLSRIDYKETDQPDNKIKVTICHVRPDQVI